MSDNPAHPTTDDREAWKSYWTVRGMSWRTEPEIGADRQRFLAERRALQPDIAQGMYPFKDIVLNRADIEWLLETHKSGGVLGPVDWSDEQQFEQEGLDLRGASLSGVDLSNLPLARLHGGLTLSELNQAHTQDLESMALMLDMAAVHLERALLWDTNLKGAVLQGAHLERATLVGTHLEKANLTWAHFEGGRLMGTHLEGATLGLAHLEWCQTPGAHFEGAMLFNLRAAHADFFEAHFEGTDCNGSDFTGARFVRASLHGANLRASRLEGAVLDEAHLEGKEVPADKVERIRQWSRHFPTTLPPTDLRDAYLDDKTSLRGTVLGDAKLGAAALADARLAGVNLSVVDWTPVRVLNDEWQARQSVATNSQDKSSTERAVEFQDAARANRQLAIALRNQGMNEQADRFAYRAQLCQRQALRHQGIKQWPAYVGSLLLWALSGYGYRLGRILAAYGAVLAVFTIVYGVLGIHSFRGESGVQVLWDAFLVSLSAIHGRTTFEQLGAWTPAAWVAAIESVVGIVIEGVFVAMLVQRFFASK